MSAHSDDNPPADLPFDLPPPILEPEMPDEELSRLIDAGNLEAVEGGLREQRIRLPKVLGQLNRVLESGLGNLGASIATLLIGGFHISQANQLTDRVLREKETAGVDELVDLAAALLQQERLAAAERVIKAGLERWPDHGRGLYLNARLHARRGRVSAAFESIARVPPDLLGPQGLATQARYAMLTGRSKAARGALKQAHRRVKRAGDEQDDRAVIEATERIGGRLEKTGINPSAIADLRTAVAIEYGSLVLELAQDPSDGGRFGAAALTHGDAGPLIQKIANSMKALSPRIDELLFATEDGEIVAAGLARIFDRPWRPWRKEHPAKDGDWLCMGSAATHPHLPHETVLSLSAALDGGVLKTAALVLPAGWRAPMVPDIIGRLTRDDEFEWSDDDEVEDVYASIMSDSVSGLVRDDPQVFAEHLARFGPILRACTDNRPAHSPYLDETPIEGTGRI